MFAYRHNTSTLIGIALFFVALVGYAFIEVRAMVTGPQLSIETPDAPLLFSEEESLDISGASKNVATLSINGSPAPLTTTGEFARTILLAPGHNTIVLTALDDLGRSTHETLHVMYSPHRGHEPQHAATTVITNDELL